MHACHSTSTFLCTYLSPSLKSSTGSETFSCRAVFRCACGFTSHREQGFQRHLTQGSSPSPLPLASPPQQPHTQCLNSTPIRSVRITTPRSEPLLDVCSQHGVGVTKLWDYNSTAQRGGTFWLRRGLGYPTAVEQSRLMLQTKHSRRCPLSPLSPAYHYL